jgi:hypothetical protein
MRIDGSARPAQEYWRRSMIVGLECISDQAL